MTVSYEEAVREVERATTDQFGAAMHDDCFTSIKAGTLRALLSAPPEPSEEEVARAWLSSRYEADAPIFEDDLMSAQAVQQLFRNRRNG